MRRQIRRSYDRDEGCIRLRRWCRLRFPQAISLRAEYVAMYTKHQISISRALIPTAGRILRNRQPASSSAFNAAAAQGVVRVLTKHPCHSAKEKTMHLQSPCRRPLALCEVDRDKASLALPEGVAGGVAVTSHTTQSTPLRQGGGSFN